MNLLEAAVGAAIAAAVPTSKPTIATAQRLTSSATHTDILSALAMSYPTMILQPIRPYVAEQLFAQMPAEQPLMNFQAASQTAPIVATTKDYDRPPGHPKSSRGQRIRNRGNDFHRWTVRCPRRYAPNVDPGLDHRKDRQRPQRVSRRRLARVSNLSFKQTPYNESEAVFSENGHFQIRIPALCCERAFEKTTGFVFKRHLHG